MSVHDINELVKVNGTFRNTAGNLTDPTALTFTFRDESGNTTAYVHGTDAELVKDSVGLYHVNVTPDASGTWWWDWYSTGAVADAEHGLFFVRGAWTKILSAAELLEHIEPMAELSNSELENMILGEEAFINRIIGPPTTQTDFFRPDKQTKNLILSRPCAAITSVSERDEDEVVTALAADDYRLIGTNYHLERRDDGTNDDRSTWGIEVTVTYLPAENIAERRQALIELCKLTAAGMGYARIQSGEVQLHPADRNMQRIAIVSQLSEGIPFV